MSLSPCYVLAVVVLCGGCTADQVHRFGYMMGSRYACMQRNSNLPNAAARKADCNVADPETQRAYEAYQHARNEPAAD
jgi:hypothetical protein